MTDDVINYVIGQLRGACWEEEAVAIETLVKQRDDLQRDQTYSYIGKDMKRWLARDLEDAKDEAEAKLAECEARLGKAVEALRWYDDPSSQGDVARKVLAEIEGDVK